MTCFPEQGLYHALSQYNCSSQEININTTLLSICRPQSHFVNHSRNIKTPNLSQYSVLPYLSGSQQFFNNTRLLLCRLIRNIDLSDMPLDQCFWGWRPLTGHTALLVSHKARYHTLCQITCDVNFDQMVVLFIKVTILPFVTY